MPIKDGKCGFLLLVLNVVKGFITEVVIRLLCCFNFIIDVFELSFHCLFLKYLFLSLALSWLRTWISPAPRLSFLLLPHVAAALFLSTP